MQQPSFRPISFPFRPIMDDFGRKINQLDEKNYPIKGRAPKKRQPVKAGARFKFADVTASIL
ncbi:MAG: hypothetical protein ACOX1H_02890 [Pseudoramibacter sp.]|jgi:hypothetical protein